jgi:tetratricopeptide (TPR) repeat protein
VNDLFMIQNRISARIVEALELKLSPAAIRRSARSPTANGLAYDAYLQGMYHSHKLESGSPGMYHSLKLESGSPEALSFFEQAVQIDPQFALAQAALGSAYMRRFFYEDADRRWEQKAFLAIEKALALDADLAEAYLARAQLAWSLPNGFPHERAIRDLQRAIALKPSLADAHVELGKIYMHIGLLDKATASNAYALRLDPGNPEALGRLSTSHVYLRECQEALDLVARDARHRRIQAVALSCLGRTDEALKLVDTSSTSPHYVSLLAFLLAQKGDHDAVRQTIARVQLTADNVAGLSDLHHVQYNIGAAYALLGDKRQAISWLKKASREGLPCYPLFERDPNLDGLRGDTEFAAFMQELKAQAEQFRLAL